MADYAITKAGVGDDYSYVIIEYTMPVAATLDIVTGLKTVEFVKAQFKTAQRGAIARPSTTAGTITITGTNQDKGRIMVWGRTY